jgi:2'-5' RNA ligase
LGRVIGERSPAIDAWLGTHEHFEGPPFRVTSFQLIASELHSTGPRHRVYADFPLRD